MDSLGSSERTLEDAEVHALRAKLAALAAGMAEQGSEDAADAGAGRDSRRRSGRILTGVPALSEEMANARAPERLTLARAAVEAHPEDEGAWLMLATGPAAPGSPSGPSGRPRTRRPWSSLPGACAPRTSSPGSTSPRSATRRPSPVAQRAVEAGAVELHVCWTPTAMAAAGSATADGHASPSSAPSSCSRSTRIPCWRRRCAGGSGVFSPSPRARLRRRTRAGERQPGPAPPQSWGARRLALAPPAARQAASYPAGVPERHLRRGVRLQLRLHRLWKLRVEVLPQQLLEVVHRRARGLEERGDLVLFVGASFTFGTMYANMLRLPLGSSSSTVLKLCVGTAMRRVVAPIVSSASGGSGLPCASRYRLPVMM